MSTQTDGVVRQSFSSITAPPRADFTCCARLPTLSRSPKGASVSTAGMSSARRPANGSAFIYVGRNWRRFHDVFGETCVVLYREELQGGLQ
jgi:hypothetical protein